MKLFETPELEVVKMAVSDVITASGDEEEGYEPSFGMGNCI